MAIASAREVKAAKAFLTALGADTSIDLIFVVVAWMRKESGTHYIGNNPFNLRPGQDDAKYRSGIRYTAKNGRFSVYASLADALRATAHRLLSAGNDYRGYGLVVRAFKSGRPGDALTALAMSRWSRDHYGWSLEHPEKNRLVPIYNSFTGFKVPIEKPAPKQRAAPLAPPQNLMPVDLLPKPDYLKPLAPRSFYRGRHRVASLRIQ